MRLDEDGAHAGAGGFLGEFNIIEPPYIDVRRAVNVKVHGAFQKIWQLDHVATISDWGNSRLAAQPATAESTPAIENAIMGMAKLPV